MKCNLSAPPPRTKQWIGNPSDPSGDLTGIFAAILPVWCGNLGCERHLWRDINLKAESLHFDHIIVIVNKTAEATADGKEHFVNRAHKSGVLI